MRINERLIDDVAILTISGNLLGGPPGSQEFKDKIYDLINRKITKVVVDLSGVKRMNSSGLGILISALTSLKNQNGSMKLASIDETMKGILIMTKLNTIFETYETSEGAAKSF
jgi:anti-sigma B factor antagonist